MFRRHKNTSNLLLVNASVVSILVVGFVVSILVPRIAIERIGEVHYGIFALIVGFSPVVAFADLGLGPGITRQFAALLSECNTHAARVIVRRSQAMSTQWLLALAFAVGLVLVWTARGVTVDLAASYVLFVLATWVTILSEIRASLVRAAGRVTVTYAIKTASLITYVLVVFVFFLEFRTWLGVVFVFVGQFASSVASYALNDIVSRRVLAEAERNAPLDDSHVSCRAKAGAHFAWREAWRVSGPERFNRIIQLATGFIERPLLVATAGLAFVGSYDLFMRLTLLVTALPGALSAPVVAMLSHDASRPENERRFHGALAFARYLNFGFAFLGFGIALTAYLGFYSFFFGVPSRIPTPVGILIFVAAAVNAVTGPGYAAMTARGRIWPCNVKLSVEAVGLIAGGVTAFSMHSGLVFVAARYLSLVVAAIGFVAIEAIVSENRPHV